MMQLLQLHTTSVNETRIVCTGHKNQIGSLTIYLKELNTMLYGNLLFSVNSCSPTTKVKKLALQHFHSAVMV